MRCERCLIGYLKRSHRSFPVFHAILNMEVGEITDRIRVRVLRLVAARDAFAERSVDEGDLLPFDSADLGGCYAASIQGRVYFDKARGALVQRVRGGRFSVPELRRPPEKIVPTGTGSRLNTSS